MTVQGTWISKPALPIRWLAVAALCLAPIFFHGCHLGGHDEDLLRVRVPTLIFEIIP